MRVSQDLHLLPLPATQREILLGKDLSLTNANISSLKNRWVSHLFLCLLFLFLFQDFIYLFERERESGKAEHKQAERQRVRSRLLLYQGAQPGTESQDPASPFACVSACLSLSLSLSLYVSHEKIKFYKK